MNTSRIRITLQPSLERFVFRDRPVACLHRQPGIHGSHAHGDTWHGTFQMNPFHRIATDVPPDILTPSGALLSRSPSMSSVQSSVPFVAAASGSATSPQPPLRARDWSVERREVLRFLRDCPVLSVAHTLETEVRNQIWPAAVCRGMSISQKLREMIVFLPVRYSKTSAARQISKRRQQIVSTTIMPSSTHGNSWGKS